MPVALFSLSLFISAALMFSVQPMVGKMLLPLVGGTPAGWIVAMAFFQLALLAGYALAYGMARLQARQHGVAYIALLALGAVSLPVSIAATAGQDTLNSLGTFHLLTLTVGLPFIALATSATTLQRLFSATHHKDAQDPYFLYAASNLGSFAGLFLYPLLVEPTLPLDAQTFGWAAGYGLLAVLGIVCITRIKSGGAMAAASTTDEAAAPLPWRQGLRWVIWAFVPASLLMGFTAFITRDLYSAPMIWVLPLGVYLLSFVIVFRHRPMVTSRGLAIPHLLAVTASLLVISASASVLRASLLPVIVHLLALGVIACAFHARLYEDRPVAAPRHLAVFYLLISVGGALAGLFNAFLAPVIFNQSLELPLVLLASVVLHAGWTRRMNIAAYTAVGVAVITAVGYVASIHFDPAAKFSFIITALMAVALGTFHPRTTFVCGLLLMGIFFHTTSENTLVRHRNFYGNIAIYDRPAPFTLPDGSRPTIRSLNHGTTLHGFQLLQGQNSLRPTSYYVPLQPVYQALQPRRVAVLGLGTGTLNCIAGPGTDTTFIEIDPAVVEAAQTYFTFLSGCNPGQQPRIILGDGRLEMQKLQDERFDLIVVDVFSSDYIPAHLMTREALQLYRDRLAPGGIIAIHISNNFFDLAPVLHAGAADSGMHIRLLENMRPGSVLEKPSRWVALGRTPEDTERLARMDARWMPLPLPDGTVRVWTDGYTNFMAVLEKDTFSLKPLKKLFAPLSEREN